MHKIVLVLLSFLLLQSVSVSGILYNGTDSFYNKLNNINQNKSITLKNNLFCNPCGIYFSPNNKKQKVLEYKVKPYLSLPTSVGDIIDSFTGFDAKILFHF